LLSFSVTYLAAGGDNKILKIDPDLQMSGVGFLMKGAFRLAKAKKFRLKGFG